MLSTNSINVSYHCKLRWLQRQRDIDQDSLASYLTLNDNKITSDIKDSFSHADKVYRGQINDNRTVSYYLRQDNVFIFDSESNTIVTYYKVSYGMPYDLDTRLRDSLVKALDRSKKDSDKVKTQAGINNKRINKGLAQINSQIKGNENEHELLIQKKKDIMAQLDETETDVKLANNQVKNVAEKLLYSKGFFEAISDVKDNK